MKFYASIWRNYYDDCVGGIWRNLTNDHMGFIGNFDVSQTLSFSTQLNGGFGTCSFEVFLPGALASAGYNEILGGHVVIFDRYGDRTYEGRITDVSLENGIISVTADGYYSQGNYIMMPTELWTADETTIGDIVKDCVEYMDCWNPTYVFIQDANFIVGKQESTEEQKVNDILEKILKFPFREDYVLPVYLAIWSQRMVYLFPEIDLDLNPYPYPDWLISAKSIIGEGIGTSTTLENVYNRIYALFDDTADDSTGPTLTTAADSYMSQYLYGIREGVLNTGEYGQTMGEELRDLALKRYEFPVQQISFSVGPLVQNLSGAQAESYRIRAGDFIIVKDLDETYQGYGGGSRSKMLRGLTGFVVSTNYSSKDGTIDIQLGMTNWKFEYQMARLGLDGGIS